MKNHGVFFTGTDTGVGKTQVAAALAAFLTRKNIATTVRKPVESGCSMENHQPRALDAETLQLASQSQENLQSICPFRFEAAVSPPRAAKLENDQLLLSDLIQACHHTDQSFLIVEGAGGFLSPIARNSLNADLATKLALPIVLVAANQLGCINHVLLSLEAINMRKLNCCAIVLNQKTGNKDPNLDNINELTNFTKIPIIMLPYAQTPAWQTLQLHMHSLDEMLL